MFDWFKKFFVKAEINPPSPYQEAILLLKRCPLKTTSVYRDYFHIHAFEKTMHEYTVLITKAINALENNHKFIGVYGDPFSIPTADFFMWPGGNYAPPGVTQAIFVSAAVELIQLYERIIDQESHSGIESYNLSQIYPIIRNLSDLAKELSEES